MPTIIKATSPTEIEAIRTLFSAYASSLGIDLSYQSFSSELEYLPGKYSSPQGVLFLAIDETNTTRSEKSPQFIGCIAVRPLSSISSRICELKRLYVSPTGRRGGTGAALLDSALKFALDAGYEKIVLDTLKDEHHAAIRLYKSRGFEQIDQYYETPILERTLFFGKQLK